MIHRIIKNKKSGGPLVATDEHHHAVTTTATSPIKLGKTRRTLGRAVRIFLGLSLTLMIIGGIALGLLYMRLGKGNIELAFMVPSIEKAINEQLTDLSVRIESAFIGRNVHSNGVHFRLRDLVVYDKENAPIANAPLAAVGLNGLALMWGKIAPSQVVFIKPTLDMVYKEGEGLSLSYAKGQNNDQPETMPADRARDTIGELMAGLGLGGDGGERPSIEKTLQQLQKVDFMKTVTAAFEEARSHRNTSSYLTQFGLRDAVIKYRQDNTEFNWMIPDFLLDLRHNEKGSIIRGFGEIFLTRGSSEKVPPWKLRFQAQQLDASKDLRLDLGFQDITPESLRSVIPELDQMIISDIPFGGKITAQFTKDGTLHNGFANLRFSAGKLTIPNLEAGTIDFEKGALKIAYERDGRKLHILPSPLSWGDNQTILSGVLQPLDDQRLLGRWKFALKGDETRLAASDFNLKPIIVEEWWSTGLISPDEELIEFSKLFFRSGNTKITMKGHIEQALSSPGVYLDGDIGTISMPVLKRLWPSFLAPDTRQWLGERVLDGRIINGKVRLALPPGTLNQIDQGGDIAPEMVTLNLKLGDLVVKYLEDLVPATIPEATLNVTGRQFSVRMPKGHVSTGRKQIIRLSHGTFAISDLRKDIPDADMNFRIAGSASNMLRFINQPTLRFADESGIKANAIKGKIKGVVALKLPLKKKTRFEDVKLKGDLRLTELKISEDFVGQPVNGGSLNIALSEKGLGISGGVVVKNIPAKLQWQRIFGPSRANQPPIRLSTSLSPTDRQTLGLGDLNNKIKGNIPVVITLLRQTQKQPQIQVRADLTNNHIVTVPGGWQKPPGSAAVLQFEVQKQRKKRLLLRNFSLVGKEILMEGSLTINENDGVIQAFAFPKISYALFNSMEVSGKRGKQGILSVIAKIKSLDGRKALRPLLFADDNKNAAKPANDNQQTDIDLLAEIETIVGDQGVSIKNTRLELRKRKGTIEWLNLKGSINSKSLFAIRLDREEDKRRYLKVESHDAGATLRLLGLFPNVENGQLSLRVDMDQKGQTEKSGTLWARNFSVVGSQTIDQNSSGNQVFSGVIGEGLGNNTSHGRVRKIKTRMVFDRLKAPFAYGQGQFVLKDAYVNGPVIGATLRGKIDFRAGKMRLGGTYVPLYGLNAAIGEIPVLSDLLVGRQGEGVFGVTFAIQGPLARPVMIINPVSLLAPGVLRQIFDFNNTVSNKEIKRRIRRRHRGGKPVMQ